MLEMIMAGVAACMGVAGGPLATADQESEGLKGTAFETGGITFSGVNRRVGLAPGVPAPHIVVERAVELWTDVPLSLSLPNGITFGDSFVPGDGAALGLLSSVRMEAPGLWRFAGLDVIHATGDEWAGAEVVLRAYLGEEVVARSTFTVGHAGPEVGSGIAGSKLLLKAAAFDSLELAVERDGVPMLLPVMLDNVFLIAPAPGALALAGIAGATACRRGRRRDIAQPTR